MSGSYARISTGAAGLVALHPDKASWIMRSMSYVRLSDLDNAAGARLIGGGSVTEDRQLPFRSLRVRPIRQRADFSCGPAALLSVLQYWGVPMDDERRLYNALGTDEKGGTRPQYIVNAARKMSLAADARVRVTPDDLRLAVGRGETVILNLQRWEADAPEPGKECEDGHFVVLVWIDDQDVYVMDPYVGGFAWMPVRALLDRWYDRPWPGEPCEERVAIFMSEMTPRPTNTGVAFASRYR